MLAAPIASSSKYRQAAIPITTGLAQCFNWPISNDIESPIQKHPDSALLYISPKRFIWTLFKPTVRLHPRHCSIHDRWSSRRSTRGRAGCTGSRIASVRRDDSLAVRLCAELSKLAGQVSNSWRQPLSWGYSRQHRGYKYITVDDSAARDGARDGPMAFCGRAARASHPG